MAVAPILIHVAVDAPFHSGIGRLLSYSHDAPLEAGALVRVPLGKKDVLGVVWDTPCEPGDGAPQLPTFDPAQIRPVTAVLQGIAPLGKHWRSLVEFSARYYQRSLGEVALAALPVQLRSLTQEQIDRRLRKIEKSAATKNKTNGPVEGFQVPEQTVRVLTAQQRAAVMQILQGRGTFLLHGATGSGKTEVYMHCAEEVLRQDERAQVLFLVPEINLTPQLQALLEARFAQLLGAGCVASLHSGLTPAQRLNHWLAVHEGKVRIVLGTRMAIMTSMPHLQLLVVDEEHDSSYKQQEGARYSARDLAVWRGRQHDARVILASATPSLESWWNSRSAQDAQAFGLALGKMGSEPEKAGAYQRLSMPERIGQGVLARVRMVDMRQQKRHEVLASEVLEAMQNRLERGEQCMVLINRRGFAPVIRCQNCDWKSDCPHCSTHQVLHMADRSLRCHHCGFTTPAPRHCPNCHSTELLPVGRGTEQVEQALQAQLATLVLPGGRAPVVMRMDADTTRHKGQLEAQLAQIHDGAVDVVVGTQMIAKGHDFRRIGLVVVVQPDGGLYAADFRAPERLFALLMQAAGRAGRDAVHVQTTALEPELLLQTGEPGHPLYQALRQHDFEQFAQQQLLERQQAGLPPFVHQALLRADARTQEGAQKFLQDILVAARQQELTGGDWVTAFPPVPLGIQRVANIERCQVLLESSSRAALQKYLQALQPLLHSARGGPYGLVRWLVDVDPLGI